MVRGDIMLKHLYKILGLVAVFVLALWFFGRNMDVMNSNIYNETVETTEETFPVISIVSQDINVNRLYGYSSNIAANAIRESVTVINDSRNIGININKHKTDINKLSYELRSVTTNELLDSGEVSAFDGTDTGLSCTIKPDYAFATSTEYSLKIVLITDVSRKINYYTRIKYYPESCHLKEKLDFVMDFHNKTIRKDESIASYIEPDSSADNSTLAYVDINSSYSNIVWGKLEPEEITDIIPTIKEINIETAGIQLVYYVTADTDSGPCSYYVKEYYRVRYSGERIYLLWFERTLETVLDISHASLNKSQISMGITNDTDMQIVSNDAVSRVAFVKNGNVYIYDLTRNILIRAYSGYINEEEYEYRLYGQQNSRVISMDEEGNTTFAVYGYVSHGAYEGKVAIILYRYRVSDSEIEELLYIPFSNSYQVLKEDFEEYCYINGKDVFYFVVDGKIYSYDIVAGKLTCIAQNIEDDNFTIVPENNMFIWKENEVLNMLDLESGNKAVISAGEAEYVRLIGVIGEHIVYGTGKNSDIRIAADGTRTYNMYRLDIADNAGNIIKTYRKKKLYISNAYVKDNVVYMDRTRKQRGAFVPVSGDNIINRLNVVKQSVSLVSRVTERTMTEWYMSFPSGFQMTEIPEETVINKYVLTKENTLYLEENKEKLKYYVYAKGEIKASYFTPAQAVIYADEQQGVVINSKNRMVWERGGRFNSASVSGIDNTKSSSKADSIDVCVYMLLKSFYINVSQDDIAKEDKSIYDILAGYVEEPVNLKGCTLDEILYFVSMGSPVIAMKDNSHAVLITAYDQSTVTIYDPDTGQSQKMYQASADEMFAASGNIFISCMKGESE